MKKLSIILLTCVSLAFTEGGKPTGALLPKVIAQASSCPTISSTDTLISYACDPNCTGGITAYQWSKVSGPGAQTLLNATSATAIAQGLVTGNYVFKVTVTNTAGLQATDTVGFAVAIPIPIKRLVRVDVIIQKTYDDSSKISIPLSIQ